MTEQREDRRISRRTIAKGAAWAIPAVPLVVATPAYATSSGGPTGVITNACKQPGESCFKQYGFVKGYTFLATITNPTAVDLYIYPKVDGTLDPYFAVTSSVPFSYSTARLYTGGAIGAPLPTALLIPAGGSVQIIINAGTNSNSANTDAIGRLVIAWGHTQTQGGDPDHPYTPAPPTNPPGEGWFTIPFSFASTPPCDNCAP
jgi:hypothetical protein